jgi:Carboxypeptidase regulatory-like domain/TonB-dependent Receptor Plug Domain
LNAKSIQRVLHTLSLVLLLAALSAGQTTKGTISGTVTDPSDAVVVGANVSAERVGGGDTRTAVSGGNGEYRLESLTPGAYVVVITAPNFATSKFDNVVVSASVITPVNVRLSPGKATETVTVEAGADRVQTETGELSAVVSPKEVKDLPFISGNPYQLAETLPGVVATTSRDSFTGNGQSFSVDGLRPRSNNFLIDGFDNNDNGITGQALQPTNQEAVADVAVFKNSYNAEFGRGGSSLSNLTFKSGTNTFHGSLWEQYSGSGLNAITPDLAASGITKFPKLVTNIFGFRLGGPIMKNKLFFFGTSQWSRSFGALIPPPTTLLLPTAAGVATLQSLGPNDNAQILIDSLAGLRGSTTDPSQVSNIDIGARTGCPAPCTVEVGPFTRSDTTKTISREWTARADYLPTQADTVYVRYTDTQNSFSPDLFANPTALPSADTQQGGPSRNFGVMWTHTFSPKVLNEVRVSGQLIDFSFTPLASTLANPLAHVPGLALSSSLGNTVWGGFSQATFPQGRGHKTIQFQDAVSITHGNHTFKLGADLAVLLIRDQIPFNSDGLIVYSGGGDCSSLGLQTCTDLANYLDGFTGPSGEIQKQFGNPLVSVPTTQQAYYFQDTWKARQNLTLDLGIRYEYQPPDASNVLPFPAVNRATALSDPLQKIVEVQPDRNNWGPRFGFAYTPRVLTALFGQDKTVIRGGAGIFYDAFFTNISNNTASAPPNTLGGDIVGGPTDRGTQDPFTVLAAIAPVVDPTNRVVSVDSNLKNPVTYQWNLNVQRELPKGFVAEVAYVGTRGLRQYITEQLNPIDPATGERLNPDRGQILLRGNRGDSNYHALQTQVRRTIGRLTFRGAYTWSRAIDNGSDIFATSGLASRWEITNNPRSDRGPSAYHHTNVASLSWVYDLPSPGSGLMKSVFGGWSTTGTASFQSGPPETVFLGGWDQNGDGEGFNDRPSLGNPRAPVHDNAACLSDPTCITGVGFDDGSGNLIDFLQALFSSVTLPGNASQFRYIVHDIGSGVNGNVTRNNFYFPGQQIWNLGVIKRIPVPFRESQLEFRADFFNAFNHPNEGVTNLVGFGNLLNPGVFGNFRSTLGGGRSITLWLKYSF